MRVTFRLIASLVFTLALVAFGFSYWQAHQEENRLKGELDRRAGVIADSLRESIEPLVAIQSFDPIHRIVDKFSNRERLVGVAVETLSGNIVAASGGLKPHIEEIAPSLLPMLRDIEQFQSDIGAFIKIGPLALHAYTVPLNTNGSVTHALTLFHDRSYISERVKRIWVNSFWRAFLQILMISLTTLVVVYLTVMTPIRKTTEWIRRVRRGESPARLNPKHFALLGPLAGEISKMAKSLDMARWAAEKEARLRHAAETIWTPEKLKEFVRAKLQGRSLFVISNREPYVHMKKGKDIECIVPASGLVTALEPILKACGGTWIAQGSGDADRETVGPGDKLKVPPDEPQYLLRRVWISPEEEKGYYYGFANEGLWPLCHIAHTRPVFRGTDWSDYKRVNEKFAQVLLEEIKEAVDPCVLVQDYHFALVPRLIKQARPDARVAIFWHIPWPNPESFGICPWQRELVEGMLGADLIGFHTQFHCNNFMETIDRGMESRIDYEHFTVTREGQSTSVKPFPISIAFVEDSKQPPPMDESAARALLKKNGIEAPCLAVGVDRLDYTKGILERLKSVEHFLDKYDSYQGRFSFVELGEPSRTAIPKYAEFVADIEKEVERINDKFKRKNWKPIYLFKKHHSHEEILPFYQAADLCLVTSLHDGMNLVAKEFVMARNDERGVLVLSQFTGASRDLTEALLVNPYDVGGTAEAIYRALEMPVDEQKSRMRQMRNNLKEHNIYRWAADLVGELAQIKLGRLP